MPGITIEDAPPRVRDLFNRGFAAFERGNLDYAIDMLTQCIELEPGFYRARLFLRAAEIKQYRDRDLGRVGRMMAQAHSFPHATVAQTMLSTGKALQAMQKIEQALKIDPLNAAYLKLLARAAEAADHVEIAVQSLALLREQEPDNPEVLRQLGEVQTKAGQTRAARECFERLVELRPHDSAAVKLLKDATAVDSMAKDGWSDTAAAGGSFRDMIRDRKVAEVLEQENKAVRSDADTDNLIKENLARVEREPGNINYRRALADLYRTMNRFDDALKVLQDTLQLLNGRDPQVDAMISQVRLQQFDHQITQAREAGQNDVVDRVAAERREFYHRDLQERVQRYPNDLQLHYEYGVSLFEQERTNEAIQQFQLAQRHPQRRVSALYYIGVCFKQKKQFDLAAEQLERASREIAEMDDMKKQVVYELGIVYDLMGKHDQALGQFKLIYSVDIAYKDVSQRVEKNYAKT